MEQFAQAGFGFEKESEVQQEQIGFESDEWEGGSPFQIGRVIIGCEINGELKMFHQTRLHWQILFEEHSNQNSHSFKAQQLIFPIALNAQQKDISLLQDHDVLLASFGFELNLEEEPEIIAAPSNLDEQAALKFIELVLESLRLGIDGPDLRMNLLKDYTRRMSVKKGQMLTVPEMLDLLVRWNACENKNFAPDGKSIALTFGIDYLEDQLGK
jgi:DNA mismatch repair ATPase MutL